MARLPKLRTISTRDGMKNAADVRLRITRPKPKNRHKLRSFVKRDWWLLITAGGGAYFMQPVPHGVKRFMLAALAISLYFGGLALPRLINRTSRRKAAKIIQLLEQDAATQAERFTRFEAAIMAPVQNPQPVLVPVDEEPVMPVQPVANVIAEKVMGTQENVASSAVSENLAAPEEIKVNVAVSKTVAPRASGRRDYQSMATRSHAGRRLIM